MKILNTTLSLLLGADYEILRFCPKDLKKQVKKILLAVLVAALTYVATIYEFKEDFSLAVAITTYLLYVLFLCRPTSAFIKKFVLTLTISAYIFEGISFLILGGINSIDIYNIEEVIIAVIIGILDLGICFAPVRLNGNMSSDYESLHKQKEKNLEEAGKLHFLEKANADKLIVTNRERTRVEQEAQIARYLSDKILQSQKSAIDKMIVEWSGDFESKLSRNIIKYYENDKKQEVKLNKADEEELESHISNLLKEKQEEFAQVIINKWAEEKKKELDDNTTKFIS